MLNKQCKLTTISIINHFSSQHFTRKCEDSIILASIILCCNGFLARFRAQSCCTSFYMNLLCKQICKKTSLLFSLNNIHVPIINQIPDILYISVSEQHTTTHVNALDMEHNNLKLCFEKDQSTIVKKPINCPKIVFS